MTLRQAGGLLSAALLLRLNFVAVDATCAQHEARSASAVDENAGHEHHSAAAAAPDETGEGPACDVPARANCCAALTSCSITLDTGSRADDALAAGRDRHLALGADRPTFHGQAPDPPPPKS